MPTYIAAAVLAYLLGSIPFGLVLGRVFLGTDVRTIGSGNIGATNVLRTGSKKLGIATLVLDAAKGYVAIMLAYALTRPVTPGADGHARGIAVGLAMIFALLGHIFPVWLKFKGGKGVATGVGVFVAVAPSAVLIVMALFVLVVVISHYVSLASIVATAAFPFFAYLRVQRDERALLPFMVAGALLIIAVQQQRGA